MAFILMIIQIQEDKFWFQEKQLVMDTLIRHLMNSPLKDMITFPGFQLELFVQLIHYHQTQSILSTQLKVWLDFLLDLL